MNVAKWKKRPAAMSFTHAEQSAWLMGANSYIGSELEEGEGDSVVARTLRSINSEYRCSSNDYRSSPSNQLKASFLESQSESSLFDLV